MSPHATDEATGAATAPGRMRPRQLFAISAYWFATNMLWSGFLILILPAEVMRMHPKDWAHPLALIFAVGAIPGVLVPLLTGPLSDRCMSRWGRRRPYMVAGVALNLLGLLVAWLAGTWSSLVFFAAGYLVMNFGNNVATASYSGVIPDIVPEGQRGDASGWMAAMTQVGNIVGIVSAGLLLRQHLTGPAYAVMGLSLVVFLLITAFGIREVPRRQCPEPLAWGPFLRSLWVSPRQHPDFAWVWFTRFLVVMGQYTVQELMLGYLVDVVGVRKDDKEMVGAGIMLAILVFAIVTGVLGGAISDRTGRKPVIYVANGVMAAACFGLAFTGSLWVIFPLAVLFGLGLGAYYSVDWALGCDVLPNKEAHAAKDMAVWHIAFMVPQIIAVPIASTVLSAFPHRAVTETVRAFQGFAEPGHRAIYTVATSEVTHYAQHAWQAIFILAAVYMLLGVVFLRNVRGVR